MTPPLVSIVLPTYNGARYLAQSIQSCRDQTYPYWELIAVDDASTDETPAILSGFAAQDDRICVIRHAENKKLPGALNTGFAQARGDYLTWTSDDNLFRPEALAALVDFLEAHPEIDLVYTDYSLIDETGEVTKHISARDPRSLVYKSSVGPCFLHRREVYDVVGGYAEDLFLAEDYDYWLRVSARFRIQPLHQDLYLYRRHGGSLTDQYQPRVMLAKEQALLRNLPTLGWADASARAEAYLHLTHLARLRHDRGQARRYLWQAWRNHPYLAARRQLGRLVRGWSAGPD